MLFNSLKVFIVFDEFSFTIRLGVPRPLRREIVLFQNTDAIKCGCFQNCFLYY